MDHFYVTVTLTYDLFSGIIVSGAYFLYTLRSNTKFGVWIPLTKWSCAFTLILTLISDLISWFFVSGAYLLYYK